ncbi:hypothetical protein PFICI_12409 [Pestalotiopsis fici W106-1]|uniref:Aromatic prenyltransferase n=1 Tax=Pestalotiopsis fici (strain W106-1 / CGMCC3.15140) TaxID=1229662 RepID=W3WNH6_PESFW|nr:uncharacterized protein PFICI_12409 [Pestalotiopsis fici W106-1]ETS75465.1 hypothetical protein PFICI_12409 [Pestalotiopsis fici W106-1]
MDKQNEIDLPIFDQVNREIVTHDQDQTFWWDLMGRSLATQLKANQYGNEEQLYYLRWFKKWIPYSFGPQPVDGNAYYDSTFTPDGSPIEYSLNWKEKKARQTVRLAIEPCSREAGTAADPLNQLASKSLLEAMAKDVTNIDMVRFNNILAETNVPDEDAERILSKLPPSEPQVLLLIAYDLEQGEILPKAYFNPLLRAIHSGTSTKKVVFDAVRKCNGPHGSYDASLATLDDYLDSRDAVDGPHVFLLGHDCIVDSPASRMKIYVFTHVTTLATALDAFHLGGRISGSTIEGGLEAVRSFWCHRFSLNGSDSDVENREMLPPGSRCLFVYEMRPTQPGQKEPEIEVKMHMPGTWLGETDAEVCQVMSSWFQKHNHPDLAARYQTDMASAYPEIDLNTPGELCHTWVSLTWTQKTGLYMTMYYTPKITQFY